VSPKPPDASSARALIPAPLSLPRLREAAEECRARDLYKTGTQTVFGDGSAPADLMLVGEQPGDREDLEGKPLVGPAGRLLDGALQQAGIDRQRVYVTNAVKHFKWKPQGRRRLHQKPNAAEIAACRPWLDAEIATVTPRLIVCLGPTASQALLGSSFRVSIDRGRAMHRPGLPPIVATVHPSAILRAPDDETRRREMAAFVDDLRTAASQLHA
jgi:uracil-DNA glycosylase